MNQMPNDATPLPFDETDSPVHVKQLTGLDWNTVNFRTLQLKEDEWVGGKRHGTEVFADGW